MANITVVYFRLSKSLTECLLQNFSWHSRGLHQHQEIPSLHWVLGVQKHQPHQGDQQGQSHHELLLRHLCQQVQQVQGRRQLPGNERGQVIETNSAECQQTKGKIVYWLFQLVMWR